MAENSWKWHDKEDESAVVIPAVQAVAVYTNPHGDIVIRQQAPMGDDDAVVVIPRAHAKKLADAIRAEAKKEFVPDSE